MIVPGWFCFRFSCDLLRLLVFVDIGFMILSKMRRWFCRYFFSCSKVWIAFNFFITFCLSFLFSTQKCSLYSWIFYYRIALKWHNFELIEFWVYYFERIEPNMPKCFCRVNEQLNSDNHWLHTASFWQHEMWYVSTFCVDRKLCFCVTILKRPFLVIHLFMSALNCLFYVFFVRANVFVCTYKGCWLIRSHSNWTNTMMSWCSVDI